jgi:hypothetical protein
VNLVQSSDVHKEVGRGEEEHYRRAADVRLPGNWAEWNNDCRPGSSHGKDPGKSPALICTYRYYRTDFRLSLYYAECILIEAHKQSSYCPAIKVIVLLFFGSIGTGVPAGSHAPKLVLKRKHLSQSLLPAF